MPDMVTSQESDTLENSQLVQGLVPPLVLYSQPERNGRVFMRHGDPSTSSTGSTSYLPQFPKPPIVSPPIQLFDGTGRVFRLDLLAEYRIGGSIQYWFDENPMPDNYLEGVDYIGQMLRDLPNDKSAAQESVASTLPVDDIAARDRVSVQSQHPGFGVFPPNNRNAANRNYGARWGIYFDTEFSATVPPPDVLNTADVVSGYGNSVLRSAHATLSKPTEGSAQNLNFASILDVPANSIVPCRPMEALFAVDIPPVAEPHTQTQASHSRAFPTFNLNWVQSGDNTRTPFTSSVFECVQPTHFTADSSDLEAVEARLEDAFLRASIRAIMPPREGFKVTTGSAAVDARASSIIPGGSRAARGRAARGGAARGEFARGGAARGGAARGGATRGRARGTTARRARGRGRAAQRGHLHFPEEKQGVSDENIPKKRKYDGNEVSGPEIPSNSVYRHLNSTEGEQRLSDENIPKKRKYDGNEVSGSEIPSNSGYHRHLHSPKREQGVSEENKPIKSNDDGKEELGGA